MKVAGGVRTTRLGWIARVHRSDGMGARDGVGGAVDAEGAFHGRSDWLAVQGLLEFVEI